ncbi:MAG: YggT family protein [Acidimicrobiales bacterium]
MASTLVLILQIVSLVFVARAIVSWFPIRPNSPIYPAVDLLYRITRAGPCPDPTPPPSDLRRRFLHAARDPRHQLRARSPRQPTLTPDRDRPDTDVSGTRIDGELSDR